MLCNTSSVFAYGKYTFPHWGRQKRKSEVQSKIYISPILFLFMPKCDSLISHYKDIYAFAFAVFIEEIKILLILPDAFISFL